MIECYLSSRRASGVPEVKRSVSAREADSGVRAGAAAVLEAVPRTVSAPISQLASALKPGQWDDLIDLWGKEAQKLADLAAKTYTFGSPHEPIEGYGGVAQVSRAPGAAAPR